MYIIPHGKQCENLLPKNNITLRSSCTTHVKEHIYAHAP